LQARDVARLGEVLTGQWCHRRSWVYHYAARVARTGTFAVAVAEVRAAKL